MKIVKYIDVFPGTTGKGDVFFNDENCLTMKQPDTKRYRVIIDVPDFHQVDGQLGPNKKVEVLETTDPAQVKVVEVMDAPVVPAKEK